MKRKAVFTGWIPAILIIFIWSACGVKSSYFQKQVPVPDAKWKAGFMPEFTLDISDTTKKYDFYLLLRHDESYPNSNLWFRLKVKEPGSKVFIDGPRMEVDLANPAGQWLGRGMGSIWEHKIRLDSKATPQFKHTGTYQIKVEQLMRYNPLPAVLNVGLVVEAYNTPK